MKTAVRERTEALIRVQPEAVCQAPPNGYNYLEISAAVSIDGQVVAHRVPKISRSGNTCQLSHHALMARTLGLAVIDGAA